jgi:hypothetical protein
VNDATKHANTEYLEVDGAGLLRFESHVHLHHLEDKYNNQIGEARHAQMTILTSISTYASPASKWLPSGTNWRANFPATDETSLVSCRNISTKMPNLANVSEIPGGIVFGGEHAGVSVHFGLDGSATLSGEVHNPVVTARVGQEATVTQGTNLYLFSMRIALNNDLDDRADRRN